MWPPAGRSALAADDRGPQAEPGNRVMTMSNAAKKMTLATPKTAMIRFCRGVTDRV